MTTEPERPVVPGLEPADGRARPLDMSKDPDRFDASRDSGPVFDPEEHPRLVEAPPAHPRVDPRHDPDRFLPPGQGQSLEDLLGKAGTHEGERNGYEWVAGLVGVFAFLALVAYLFNSVLTP